ILCQLAYFELVSIIKSLGKDTLFIGVGDSGKSGQMIAYLFRTSNGIPEWNFKFISEVGEDELRDYKHVVFLDDIIGSGNQFLTFWDEQVKPLLGVVAGKQEFFLISLTGTELGRKNIIGSIPGIKIIVPHILQPQLYEEKEYELIRKYGNGLWKKGHELGWNNQGETIMFFYNVPNNTLPIFWSTKYSNITENNWKPLQPRTTTVAVRTSKKGILDVLKSYIYRESFSSHEYMLIIRILIESYSVLEPGDLTGEDMFKFAQTASDFFAPYEGILSHGAIFESLPNLRKGIADIFYEYVRLKHSKEIFKEFLYLFILDEFTRHQNDALQTHLVKLAARLLSEFPYLEEVLVEELGLENPSECLRAEGSYLTLLRKEDFTDETIVKLKHYRENGVDQSKYFSEQLLSRIFKKPRDLSNINLDKVYLFINAYGQMKIWNLNTINKYKLL
ncbi:hypothetical protein V7111_27170, partial [Neobacillus niacini]|uniref:phosphoribosyltransferase-like protein n=1 Tax=Neobacillus niacini TaxID=86668 RepID=UPI0030026184